MVVLEMVRSKRRSMMSERTRRWMREKEVECGIGEVATVWDGEVAGMAEGLASLPRDGRKVLILADSKAAIAAVKRVGRTGKTRSRHLQKVFDTVAEIKEEGGKSNWGG